MRRASLIRSSTLVIAALSAASAWGATDYSWNTGTNNWGTAANWSPSTGTPGSAAGDTATISIAGTYTVSLNLSPANPLTAFTINNTNATFQNSGTQTLTVDGPFNISAGKMTMNGNFTIAGSGTLTNQGTIQIVSATPAINMAGFDQQGILLLESTAGSHSRLVVNNGFSNSGVITLTSAAGTNEARLTINSGALNNTAAGVVNFNVGSGTGTRNLIGDLTNHGTVNVNYTTGFTKAGGQYTNNSSFTVASGATLTYSGGGTFTQAGGTLDVQGAFQSGAGGGDTFTFTGGNITGGLVLLRASTLNLGVGAGSGAFALQGATALTGNVKAGQSLWVRGVTGVNGQTTAASGLTNAGQITLRTLSATTNSNLLVTAGTLLNDTTGVIDILGDAADGGTRELRGTLDNRGLIVHDYATASTFFGQTTAAANTNSGVIRVTSGTLRLRDNNSLTNEAAGTITGGGTLQGITNTTFTNQGTFAPGNNGAGILTIQFNAVTYSSSANLAIELGGTTVGSQYDRLAHTGTAALAGTLDIDFINGFENAITASDTFTILTATTRTGFFTNATPGSGNTATTIFSGVHQFDVTYQSNSVVLSNYVYVYIPEPTAALALGIGAMMGFRRGRGRVHLSDPSGK